MEEPRMRIIPLLAIAIVLLVPARATAASCESLAFLALPDTTITTAETVADGAFTPPPPARGALIGLPTFCRVAATLRPSRDSQIRIEVWMPASAWNGRFMGVGNGGLAGTISYGAMGPLLQRGYAVASTDTGHEGSNGDARWALGHPERQIDFGYRAVHEMTLRAKTVVTAFYDAAPRHAYWNGCSTGGRQGLLEAQRFPDDYDGIIAGAPVSNWVPLVGQLLSVAAVVRRDGASLPPAKRSLWHDTVMARCDAIDGVRDGILEDPRRCTVEPATLRCPGGDGPDCLTDAQVAAAERIYRPLRDNATGGPLYPGFSRGGELDWEGMPRGLPIAQSYYRFMVAGDPDWDFRTLTGDLDLARAAAADRAVGQLSAVDPDLRAFRDRGGKLIQYHGFGEPEIPSESSIEYYDSVVRQFGEPARVGDFYRLFMVPGMGHCRGGTGATDQFDIIAAIERWVEQGEAPARIIASRVTDGVIDRTRPLCPYPQVAQWIGSGSTDDAANFRCAAPQVMPLEP
jgi:feruloyl esterase